MCEAHGARASVLAYGTTFSRGAHASLPFADPVTAGRDAVVLAEGLGERCGRLVPDLGGNSIDGIVAGFEHEGGLVHSTRHHVSMYRLAKEPRKPRCVRVRRAPKDVGTVHESAEGPFRCKGPTLRQATLPHRDRGF